MMQVEQGLEPEMTPWYLQCKSWLKIIITLTIVTCLVLAIVFNDKSSRILQDFLQWMQDNPVAGSFAFIAVYWFCVVLFLPASLLTLGAGFVFRRIAGPWAGIFLATVLVFIAAALGATTAFVLARFVLREQVASYRARYPRFDIVDQVVQQQGFKVTVLLRLSPVIPFNAFNYFMGLTGVQFRDFNLAHIGMLPGTCAYCFIGGTLGAIGESVEFGSNPLILIITVVGTLIALVGMVYISIIAKREFDRIAQEQQAQSPLNTNHDE